MGDSSDDEFNGGMSFMQSKMSMACDSLQLPTQN